MKLNRIRRYDQLWSSSKSMREQADDFIPPGFTLLFLNHLTVEQRQALEDQKLLYQWAYREAQRKADNEFFGDWVI